jgi:hypothetical protein
MDGVLPPGTLDDHHRPGDVIISLHLVAALASTTLGHRDDAAAHLQEAADIADRPGGSLIPGAPDSRTPRFALSSPGVTNNALQEKT